jgi:hypothetical protein
MERAIRALAGTLVTVSVILGYLVSPYWFLLTLFVGLNLLQSSMTEWCLAEQIFTKLGIGVAKDTTASPKPRK